MNKPLPAKAKVPLKQRRHNTLVYLRQHWQLYLIFMLPAFVLTIIFRYIPMGGVAIAFMDYNPFRGLWHSEWVGLAHFKRFLSSPDFMTYLMNTLKLSVFGLLWGFPAPILLAFLLNRILSSKIKQKVQLVLYMPNFISSIIYTAALSNASKDLKEAAVIDGANLIQQIKTVEWPAIKDTVLIQFIMAVGNIMSVGFEKAYALQTDLNMGASEIISTYVYKKGLLDGDYGFSTAVGLFNTVINIVLLISMNTIVKKMNEGKGI